jgi:Protein of unknown function (DUF3631)
VTADLRLLGSDDYAGLPLPDCELAAIEAEAEANDGPSANTWRDTLAEERPRILADAALTRANIVEQEREATRPLTTGEAETVNLILMVGAERLADALDGVEAFLRRFVVFGRPEAIVAVVLWIAHVFAIDYAETTPYLAITSPEKGSGKTRLLECLRLLTRAASGIFVIPTASTIYRTLEAHPGTPLLLDELDAVFKDRTDKYEEVRGIINAGHRRGATVPRTVSAGNRHKVELFPVFSAKALAGIGKLPDTIADRSIPVLMVKRKRSEPIEKFRERKARRDAEPIVDALLAAIGASPPEREAEVPDELPDRAADGWEPLLAIADAAGAGWPAKARRAAIILHGDRADDDSLGLRLLADTRLVFNRLDVDRLATAALIAALKEDEEAPWTDDRRPLTPERLAHFLRPFGIRSKQMKVHGENVRGFLGESFSDSWDRYLPTPATPSLDSLPHYPERAGSSEVAGWGGGSGPEAQTVELPIEDEYPASAWDVTA